MTTARPGETLYTATADFLRRYPPFDRLEDDALAYVTSRLSLGYYPEETVILSPTRGEPAYFHIIQRGVVRQTDADSGSTVTSGAGEAFSVGSLLERRPVRSTYTALKDTFCYQLPADDFRALLDRSARFRDFATRYLASLLQESRRLHQIEAATAAGDEQTANRSLRSLVQREPVSCTPRTSIGEALRAMQQARIGSIVVVTDGGRPEGILTRYDVLGRIALARRDLDEPVSSVMTPRPLTLPADATAYDAAVVIARAGIRHIPVMDGDALIGIVTERDLFALQHVSLRGIRRTLAVADDLPALQNASREIRTLARNLLRQGLGAEQLTYIVSTLNDALTARVIDLEVGRHPLEDVEWCWLAFGSEGRYEQTISTDQDNGIVFTAQSDEDAGALRVRLLPIAQAINQSLDACGFPLCRGGIMAGNPKWCLSLGEWRARFEHWIANTQPEELLEAVIFFDFRPLHGRLTLAETLRETQVALVKRHPVFLKQLASYALESRPPLGTFGAFATEVRAGLPDTIDLKKSGARLFVDAARVIGLAAGVPHTNTAERLRQGGPRLNLGEDEIAAATDAFFFIQSLRLRTQIGHAGPGDGELNRIDPDRLTEVDRRILKESFRQARALQTRLALDYEL